MYLSAAPDAESGDPQGLRVGVLRAAIQPHPLGPHEEIRPG